MKPRSSRILKLLADGQLPAVFKLNLADPRAVEIAALCGVDAVWLCNEHVPNDWLNLEHQIRAARIHNIDTLVRVGRGSYSDYIRPFEADATGIIVPHVATVEEARQIVEWVRFYPVGKRALDGGNLDGQFCLIPFDEYLQHSNQERLVILQIESPEALENVEEIAAVPGFNGILFGAGDFSHRIGKAGQIDDPIVAAARQRVGAACRRHGKFAMSARISDPLSELISEGYQVMSVGADVIGLTTYIRQRLQLVQGHIANLPAALKPSPRSVYT